MIVANTTEVMIATILRQILILAFCFCSCPLCLILLAARMTEGRIQASSMRDGPKHTHVVMESIKAQIAVPLWFSSDFCTCTVTVTSRGCWLTTIVSRVARGRGGGTVTHES